MSHNRSQRLVLIALLLGGLAMLEPNQGFAQQPRTAGRRDKVSAVRQANFSAPDPAPQLMPASEVANALPLDPADEADSLGEEPANQPVAYNRASRSVRAPQRMPNRSTRSPRLAQQPRVSQQPRMSQQPRVAQRNSRMAPGELLPTPSATMTEADVFGDSPEMVPEGTIIEDGGVHFEGAAEMMDGDYAGSCNNCCNEACCDECCFVGPWFWENLSFQGGVQAFKSSPDQGEHGNFGFHEGINWAIPLLERCGIGFQAGAMGVHSNFSGTTFSDDSRGQFFGTTGLFYRPECQLGLQGGAVLDYLTDDLQDERNVAQLRAEISLLGHCGHEFGAWTAMSTGEDSGSNGAGQDTWESTDMFAFFYRHRFCSGALLRGWGGFTSDDEGLIGGDALVPITMRWSLASAFNYRVPSESTQLLEAREEGWGASISLVWNLGYDGCESRGNRYRPLFSVADNTTLMLRRR